MSVGSMIVVGVLATVILAVMVVSNWMSYLEEDAHLLVERDACDLCGTPVDIGVTRCHACGWDRAVKATDGLRDVFVARQAAEQAVQALTEHAETDDADAQERGVEALARATQRMPGLQALVDTEGDALSAARRLEEELRQMLTQASQR